MVPSRQASGVVLHGLVYQYIKIREKNLFTTKDNTAMFQLCGRHQVGVVIVIGNYLYILVETLASTRVTDGKVKVRGGKVTVTGGKITGDKTFNNRRNNKDDDQRLSVLRFIPQCLKVIRVAIYFT